MYFNDVEIIFDFVVPNIHELELLFQIRPVQGRAVCRVWTHCGIKKAATWGVKFSRAMVSKHHNQNIMDVPRKILASF